MSNFLEDLKLVMETTGMDENMIREITGGSQMGGWIKNMASEIRRGTGAFKKGTYGDVYKVETDKDINVFDGVNINLGNDVKFIENSDYNPERDFYVFIDRLKEKHPDFAPYLQCKYNQRTLSDCKKTNYKVFFNVKNDDPEEWRKAFKGQILDDQGFFYYLDALELDLAPAIYDEFMAKLKKGDDNAIDFLRDFSAGARKFGDKYHNIDAQYSIEAGEPFESKALLVSDLSHIIGIPGIIGNVQKASLVNSKNQVIKEGFTIEDKGGVKIEKAIDSANERSESLKFLDPENRFKTDPKMPQDNPQALKSIADLSLMYALMGVSPTNISNISYNVGNDGQVSGFYLDSLNKTPAFFNPTKDVVVEKPKMLSREAADGLAKLSEADYKKMLEAAGVKGEALSKAVDRFNGIKTGISDGSISVIDDWSKVSLKALNEMVTNHRRVEASNSFEKSLDPEVAKKYRAYGEIEGLFTTLYYPEDYLTKSENMVEMNADIASEKYDMLPAGSYQKPKTQKPAFFSELNLRLCDGAENADPELVICNHVAGDDFTSLSAMMKAGLVRNDAGPIPFESKDKAYSALCDALKSGIVYAYAPGEKYPKVISFDSTGVYISDKNYEIPLLERNMDSDFAYAFGDFDVSFANTHAKLEGTPSPVYTELENNVTALAEMLADPKATKEAVDNQMEEVLISSEAYLDHCKKNPKSGSRRATRVNLAKSVKEIIELKQNGVEDIHKFYSDKIKERLTDQFAAKLELGSSKNPQFGKLADALRNNPEAREKFTSRLEKLPEYTKIKKDLNLADLACTAKLDDEAFAKVFKLPAPAEMIKKVDAVKLPDNQAKQDLVMNI